MKDKNCIITVAQIFIYLGLWSPNTRHGVFPTNGHKHYTFSFAMKFAVSLKGIPK